MTMEDGRANLSLTSLCPEIGRHLLSYTRLNLHIGYRMGARATTGGAIDCSGWTAELTLATMEHINRKLSRVLYDIVTLAPLLKAAAAPQIERIGHKTGFAAERDIENGDLKSGTLIGIRCQTGGAWAARRWNQISHIVAVVRAEDNVFVSQSAEGLGVYLIPYDQWLAQEKDRGSYLFAANPFKLVNILGAPRP